LIFRVRAKERIELNLAEEGFENLANEESEDWSHGFCHEFGLSYRESKVLQLSIKGLTNRELADHMNCAESTIITYWRRIYQKTRCQTRNDVQGFFIEWLLSLLEV